MKNLNTANLLSVSIVGTSSAGMACLWLIDASVKNVVLLGIGTLVCSLLARASAATRHCIWAATLLGLIFMPIATLVMPEWRILPDWLSIESRVAGTPVENSFLNKEPVSRGYTSRSVIPVNSEEPHLLTKAVVVAADAELAPSDIDVERPSNWPLELRLTAASLLAVWATGVVLCLSPAVLAFFRLIRLERDSTRNGSLRPLTIARIVKAAKELRVKSPRILVGSPDAMPMVWSFGRSRILLPVDCEMWSEAKWKAVISHELIHLKRRDPMLFTCGLVARALNWFNPLAWYAVHRLRIECEQACDDHVLKIGVDASEYATHLLQFATSNRSTRGTSSLAFAMSTKPNIEQRIVSVLDEKRNRSSVTLRRAAALLMLVSCGVAVLAALHATVASELPTSGENQVEIKYPYCVIEVDKLEARPLGDAIAAFNLESKQSPTGATQRPVSEPETLTAIAKSLQEPELDESVKTVLREIEKTRVLPAKAYFRRFTRFDDEQQMHGVWWVRLCIEGDAPPLYSVPVRTTHLFTRPYSQLERQQNSEQGVTLINRRSSYFENPPTIQPVEDLPKSACDRLIASMQRGLARKSIDELKALFNWDGAVLNEFVESELQMLMNATVHSMKVVPMQLSGTLLHWSGFRAYSPNLPVVGYLEIEFTKADDKDGIRRKISIELGKTDDQLRLVNYVAEEPKFPAALAGISIGGHTERLSDGIFQITSLISNPGELLSAHLANEEVWHRDYEHKRKTNQVGGNALGGDAKSVSKVIEVRNLRVAEVAKFLDNMYRARIDGAPGAAGIFSVIPDVATNSLAVNAHQDDIARIEAIVKVLDEKGVAPINDGIKCNEIVLATTLDVKDLVSALTQFFGGKANGRVQVFGLDDLQPNPQRFVDAFQVGGRPSISGSKIGIVADCLGHTVWVFALPEDISKIEAIVEKRTDTMRDFRASDLIAVVGTESIFAGDMMAVVEPMVELTRASQPPGQEKWLRSMLIREVLPQYIETKALYQEFFRDMQGTKTPKEVEEMQDKVRRKAAQIFRDKQLPIMMKKYGVNERAALERILEERSLSLMALQNQFTERVLSLELERKHVPENYEFSREELLEYYKAHEQDYLDVATQRPKAFHTVESDIRTKLAAEKRSGPLRAYRAEVMAQTKIWTLWPADVPNSLPLAELTDEKRSALKPREHKTRKVQLVDRSSGDPVSGIKVRVRYFNLENAETQRSVELKSDEQGIVVVELSNHLTIDIDVVSSEWWEVGKVRFVCDWDEDQGLVEQSKIRTVIPPPTVIKLNRGQPVESFDRRTIVR